MSTNLDILIQELSQFGLDQHQAAIYLELLKNGPSTALKLHQKLNIPRTQIYYLTNKLSQIGLIKILARDYGTKFEACSYYQLSDLLQQKKSQVLTLEKSLPNILNQLGRISPTSPKSKVINYHGLDGLKQVTWNSTQAKGILRIFELSSMSAFLDFDFCEKVRQEFINQKLTESRQLTNLTHVSPWTNISDFVYIWNCRYIDPAEIKMSTEIAIYNNITAIYQYQKNQIFCVEIYDQDLADTQKAFFDFVWKRATKMRLLNLHGETILKTKPSPTP